MGLDPEDVCIRVEATYDASSGVYILKSFARDVAIAPEDKKIFGDSLVSNLLLKELGNYFRLSILWYLISAKDIPLSEVWIRPDELPGGEADEFMDEDNELPREDVKSEIAKRDIW